MPRARRPKAAQLSYYQGDGTFNLEVVKRDGESFERLLITLRENKLDGKRASVALDEYELTVLIHKAFEALCNLQARRIDAHS